MSENQYPGGFIKKDPPTVTKTSAVGIWSLGEIAQYNKSGNWPTAKRPPDPPTIGTAILDPMGLSANISFTQPSSNGGLQIISYTANSSVGNLSNTVYTSGNGVINITGLAANTSYTFTVYDTNLVGKSITSANSNAILSATIPGAPTIGTVTINGRTATIPVTQPSSNGRGQIIGYTATSNTGAFANTIIQSGNGNIIISGLTGGSTYTFTANCNNIVGFSLNSNASNPVTAVNFCSLFSWGTNDFGQLGLDDNIDRTSPVQVGSLLTWNNISAGKYYTAAIKRDGSLWAWGNNDHEQLGLGDATNRNSPVRVGSLLNWNKVACAQYHTVATKTDGSLWAWGYNNQGQLGLGDIANRNSPVQVGSLLTWKNVACYVSDFTVATQTDGSLWAWGSNSNGELGLGHVFPRNSPVQVGTLLTWNNVAAGYHYAVATKTDGSLWAWGYNGDGQLGLGDIVSRSSPVQVGTLLTWNKIACGEFSTMATKTDGSLWTWGNNSNGRLGLGDDVPKRSSPVQVGTLLTWNNIAGGRSFSMATKTDGSLWAWGANGVSLGLGDIPVEAAQFKSEVY
jgi:hypothetical protein